MSLTEHTTCTSLYRTGRVVGYAQGRLIVDVSVASECDACAKGRGCGMGLLARRQHPRVEVQADCLESQLAERYPVGSGVTLAVERQAVGYLALLVYAAPMLLALVVSGALALSVERQWVSVGAFFGTLMCALVALRFLMRGGMERFRPRLVS
ncbi:MULTISPECIES: SoxR reducing system RseC family protein [unclassified Halomonas]|uniref:SoxR reducing system RseC family protein n=1 Tax=Halomonadaceae TaxID=28256 RepID=UPI001E3E40E7|nr:MULTISPECIES: SoxR reducing system RseC family protein [unclassified Halomonas]